MRFNNLKTFLLLSLLCSMLGTFFAYIDSTGTVFAGLGNFISQDYTGFRGGQSLSELSAVLPKKLSLYLHIVDRYLIFYGAIAVVGILVTTISLVGALKIASGMGDLAVASESRPLRKQGVSSVALSLRRIWSRCGLCRLGLTGKMIAIFGGIIGLFGVFAIVTVHHTLSIALRDQAFKRAAVLATNLRDAAAGHLQRKDLPALQELMKNYANRPDVAYLFWEDRKGRVLAHSLERFPGEVQAQMPRERRRDTRHNTTNFRGGEVYEASVLVVEGQTGTMHVGIWRKAVDRDIKRAVMPLIMSILFVTFVGVMISTFLVRGMSRPIIQLAESANRISNGDFNSASVGVEEPNEIGELARSLERMRASLKAAMTRLAHRESPSGKG